MNPEQQDLADPTRQLINLRQVIVRSEAAITALQKLVCVAQGKIRILEAQSQNTTVAEPSLSSSRVPDHSLNRLKMF